MEGEAEQPAAEGSSGGDWLARLRPEARQRIKNKLLEALKRYLPVPDADRLRELKIIAMAFEEKTYTEATSQSDYLRTISHKMLSIDQKNIGVINRAQSSHALGSPNTVDSATRGVRSQMGNQGQPLTVPLVKQSIEMQPILSQNLQNNPGPHNSSNMAPAVSSIAGICQSTICNTGQTSSTHNISGVSEIHTSAQRQMQQVKPQQPIICKQYQQQSRNPSVYSHPAQKPTLNPKTLPISLLKPDLQEQQQSLLQPTQMQVSQRSLVQISSNTQACHSIIRQTHPARVQSAPNSSVQQNQQKSIPQSITSLRQQHSQSLVIQEKAQPTMHQQLSPHRQQTSSAAQHSVLSGQQQVIGQQLDMSDRKETRSLSQQTSVSDIEQQRLWQQRLGQRNKLLFTQQPHQILNQQQQQQQQQGLQSDSLGLQQEQLLAPQSSISGPQQQKQQQLQHQQQHLFSSEPIVSSVQTQQLQKKMLQENRIAPQQQTQQSSLTILQLQGKQSQQPASKPQKSEVQFESSDMQQQLSMQQQPNPSKREMQQNCLASDALFQSQNAIEQQKQLVFSLRGTPEVLSTPSLDSTSQTGYAGVLDLQEEICQKIKTLNELCFAPLNEFNQILARRFQQENLLPLTKRSQQFARMRSVKITLERMLAFMQLSKCDIQPTLKAAIPLYEKQIFALLDIRARMCHLKPRSQQQLQQSCPMPQQQPSQVSQLKRHENNVNQGGVGSLQNSANQSQQVSINTPSQGSVDMLQPNPRTLLQQCSAQQHLKQQQEQHQQQQVQLVPPQKMQLQMQRHQIQHQIMQQEQEQQIVQKHPSVQEQLLQKQKQLPQKMPQAHTEDLKGRHCAGMKPESYKQQFAGQCNSFYHQQLKIGTPFYTLCPPSDQMSQHSSPLVDQQSYLSSLPKPGMPLQFMSSSRLVPSPSGSLLPSPVGDSGKHVLGITSPSNAVNLGLQQTSLPPPHPQPLVLGTPGISTSPLLAEFTALDGNQVNATTGVSEKASSIDRPIDRLVRAVELSAPSTMSSSMSDITSVLDVTDTLAGSAPGSRAVIGEDLVAMTKCLPQAKYSMTQDGNAMINKMKRQINVMPPTSVLSPDGLNNSFKQLHGLDATELVSTATSRVKRRKVEVNHTLVEEIEEINQQLIDSVVSISDEDADLTAVAAAGGEGTVIKCSISGVALGSNLKSQFTSAQTSPILPLRLLIPAKYPKCSPLLLDKPPLDYRQNFEDLSDKTKSSFSMSLRSLSQPISLAEMARTWDFCVRRVILEYVQQTGGGSFSTRYGTWENCVGA